jgi:hypothetical protein
VRRQLLEELCTVRHPAQRRLRFRFQPWDIRRELSGSPSVEFRVVHFFVQRETRRGESSCGRAHHLRRR